MRHGIEPDIDPDIDPDNKARAFKNLKKLRKTITGFDLLVVDTWG